jgi:hydrogenase/urease accessory protein HupE
MLRDANLNVLSIVCALFFLASPATAHDPSLSAVRIVYRGNDAVVSVNTHISRLMRAEGRSSSVAITSAELDNAVRERLHLSFDGKTFIPQKSFVLADSANDLLSWQTIVEPSPSNNWQLLARIYPEDETSRTVVTIIRNGQPIDEALLDWQHPCTLRGHAQLDYFALAARYGKQGIEHILFGADHILFVVALLLLGGSLRSLFCIITAFTLAHSLTLTLAATNTFAPSPRIIEPAIALSIVAVAVENLRRLKTYGSNQDLIKLASPKDDLRPRLALIFGLIHGFGFAGALIEVGLPKEHLALALASFNIGVEIGQATIVLAIAPVVALLAIKCPDLYRRIAFFGSICIGIAGGVWFVTRILQP